MKKVIATTLILLAATNLWAQSPVKPIDHVIFPSHRAFRIGVDAEYLQKMLFIIDDGRIQTGYAAVSLTPDFRFSRHWGVRLSAGYGFSPQQQQLSVFPNEIGIPVITIKEHLAFTRLMPYYELSFRRWYINLAAGVGLEWHKYLWDGKALDNVACAGLLVEPRVGWHLNDNWDCQVAVDILRIRLDLSDMTQTGGNNGTMSVSVGVYRVF